MMTLKEFLHHSYTPYHTVANCVEILEENGFERIFLTEKRKLERNGRYYCIKNDSALAAFVVGDLTEYVFNIAESHTDSPCLKIKGDKLQNGEEGKRLNVEAYGGGILYSFLDIPLKVAGRLLIEEGGKLYSQIVTSDYNVSIPSLCIHHDPTVNDGVRLNVQNDMLPLFGEADDLYATLTEDKVVDADLFVAPDVAPCDCGANGEFLLSPRIDNLTSVYGSVLALINAAPKGVAMAVCFDNEEIGSRTKQGAASAFLPKLLRHINKSLGFGETDLERALENGFALSVDNGHAVHPAHPEKSDVLQKTRLNGGIVIKRHVNYATDGLSAAVVKMLCDRNGIAYQEYYNRSDLRCGSTLGPITGSQLAINVCDVGLAQLAMHSAVETVGSDDVKLMENLLRAFFDTAVNTDDGAVEFR